MQKLKTISLIGLTLALTIGIGARAAAEDMGRIPRITHSMEIDGLLDEAVWQDAWQTELSFEVMPGDNTPAPVRSQVLIMHDESHLYVGFRAWDPDPSAIRAHLSDRDDAWNDDWIGVVLDTFNDERRDYLLLVNPLGVQMDMIEVFPTSSSEWDGIWDSSARISDWGWSAEMRIPFSTLRFQRSDQPQVWGFDAIRGYPRDRFRQMGAFPRDRNNNCYLCQALKIEGFDGVSSGHNIDLLPTVTASRTEAKPDFPAGDYDDREDDLEFGFTARWGFTPNLTLGATVNPDFSQVEADAVQLDVNQPFELFLPEKRPFFQEGADFFNTPVNAVYTRTMRDPSWGMKVTGKEGEHTLGAYMLEDEITNLIIPGAEISDRASLDESNTASVLRYKKDFGNRYTVGLLGTNRQGDQYRNSVAGLDLDLRLSERDRIQCQVLGSRTRYPDEVSAYFGQPDGDFDGSALDLFYSHGRRTWSIWAQGNDYSGDFRADLGFVPQVDVRGGEFGTNYDWIGTDRTWYSNLNLKTKLEHRANHSGNLLFEEQVIQFTANGPLQSRAVFRIANGQEGLTGRVYGADTFVLATSMKPNRHGDFSFTLRAGDRIDYTNEQQGSRIHLNPGFRYQFGRHFRVEARHIYERMTVDAGRLYTANISETTIAWQFNARSFVRAILQHVQYDFVTARYTDGRGSRSRRLFSQLLYSYKLNPQTVLFLGYSDRFHGNQDYDLTRATRSVFFKLGYAWVF